MYFLFCRLKTINETALEELNDVEPRKDMDPDYAPEYHDKARAQKPVASSSASGGSIPRGPGSGLLWWQKANRRPPGRKKKSYYRLKPEVFDDPAPETYSRLDKRKDNDDDDDDYYRSQKSQRGGRGGKRGRPLKALTIRDFVGSPDYVPEFDEDLVAKNKKYYQSTSALQRERQFIDCPPSQKYQKRKKKVRYEYNYSSSPTSDSDLDSEANRAANAILKETKTTNDEILSQYPDLEIMDDNTAQILKTLPVDDLVTLLNSVSKGSNSVLSVQSCVEENGETTIYVVEEERPKPGASTSTQPSDVAEESSESVALTNANGEPIMNVTLEEDPEQVNVNYDSTNVGITVTESSGLQVTEVTEIVTPRPPPLQPAPGYLMSKTRAANEDRYKYKSLAGNPEPITVVSSSNASLASPIGTVTIAETSSRQDFDQSIIQQAMETMNPSLGAEAKPLMPVIYYKCKDSNQIFSVPVTHEQAINIAAGKAEYRPDLGQVVPMNNNNNEASVLKDEKSSLPPSRSATPMSSNEPGGEIDIRPSSPAYSDHSVRISPSLGASSSAADSRRQQRQNDRRREADEKRYDLDDVVVDDVNDDDDDDDDDDEIEIEIQTDEAGNIICTNAETLLKKVGNADNATTTTNPVTPSTTSHLQTIPRQPILYNAAHIQHNNQDSYTSRSSISHEYNTATDYQNVLPINTGSAFQTVATTQQQQQQQPLLSLSHSVSTHSIGCGDDLVDAAVSRASTPQPKPAKESRTIAIQTSPSKDASNDDNDVDDDDGTSVGIQTQTSPNHKKRRRRIVMCVSDSGSDSNYDDVMLVESRSNPEVTERSDSQIPTSWIVHDTIYPLYAYQVQYNEAMWKTCGLSGDTDIQLLISDDSDDTATHPSPDTQHCTLLSPAEDTQGKHIAANNTTREELPITQPTVVESDNMVVDTADKDYESNIYDHVNNEVTIIETISADEVAQGEPLVVIGSGIVVVAENYALANDQTEMSNENNSVLSNSPDHVDNDLVINGTMEMCVENDSQVADDERNALQNAGSIATEELTAECSSTNENQSEIEKDANNHQKDANKKGEVLDIVTPVLSKADDGAKDVDVAVNDVEDDRSTSPDSVRLPLVNRQRTLGIFSRKGFGGTGLRIKLKAPSSKSYADDIANDADAEDDDYDEFDDDDDDDEEEDDDDDPPEYPSFTRRKSSEENMNEQHQTDDGSETEPGDEHPNSEGWESEFADENDDGEANSKQNIIKSSEISQGEKQASQEYATPRTDKQGVTTGQPPKESETSQPDEQVVTLEQSSQESATPQIDEQSDVMEQASQESAIPENEEQDVSVEPVSRENITPQIDEEVVIMEPTSPENTTSQIDEEVVIMESAPQENTASQIVEQGFPMEPTSQIDEQGVIMEPASQENTTSQIDEEDVKMESASQENTTSQIGEQGVIMEISSQENTRSEIDEQGIMMEKASQEGETPQPDEQASQEAVLHLSQLANGVGPNDGSSGEGKPLQDEQSSESNQENDDNKDLKEEMITRSLPASPYHREISQVS